MIMMVIVKLRRGRKFVLQAAAKAGRKCTFTVDRWFYVDLQGFDQ
jgi:hypothetical protein